MKSPPRAQHLTLIHGILCLVLLLLVIQLWLLSVTIDACLDGHESLAWPAAFASLLCLALNVALVLPSGRG